MAITENVRINFEAGNLDRVEGRIKAIGGAINLLGGAVETTVGLMGMIGVDEKQTKKFQEMATSAIALADGTKRIFEGYKELREAIQLFAKAEAAATATTIANTAATTTNNAAQAASVGILAKARAAWNAFTAALARNPITLIAVALAAIIGSLITYAGRTDEATDATDALNRSLEENQRLLTLASMANEEEIAAAKARGASEIEIAKIRKRQLEEQSKIQKDMIQEAYNYVFALKDKKASQDEINKAEKIYNEELLKGLQLESKIKIAQSEITGLERARAIELGTKAREKQKKADEDALAAYKTLLETKTKIDEGYLRFFDAQIIGGIRRASLKGNAEITKFEADTLEIRKNGVNKLVEFALKMGRITEKQAEVMRDETENFITFYQLRSNVQEEGNTQYIKGLNLIREETGKQMKAYAEANKDLFKDYSLFQTFAIEANKLVANGVKLTADAINDIGKKLKLKPEQVQTFFSNYIEQLEKEKDELRKQIQAAAAIEDETRQSELAQLEQFYKEGKEMFKDEKGTLLDLEEVYQRQKAEINKKYDDIEIKQAEEVARKKEEIAKKAKEEVEKIENDEREFKEGILKALLNVEDGNYFERKEKLEKFFEGRMKLYPKDSKEYKKLEEEKTKALEDFVKNGTKLTQFFSSFQAQQIAGILGTLNSITSGMLAMAEQDSEDRLNAIEAEYNEKLATITGTEEEIAAQTEQLEYEKNVRMEEERKRAFEDNKKLKIADVITSGISAAFQAFGGAMQLGPILGPILGAILSAMILTQMANTVSSIKKQQYTGSTPTPPNRGGGGGGGATGAMSTALTGGQFNQPIPNPNDPGNQQFGNSGNPMNSPNGMGMGSQPIRAYVVSSDVSNGLEAEQQLQNRRRL